MKEINASNLTFQESKRDLISELKGNETYKDYNYEASGINIFTSLLANHQTKLSYYVKMLLDESNADAFKTMESLYALSTNRGFLPKGYKCAKATVSLKLYVTEDNDPTNSYVSINRGATISSSNDATDKRLFNVLETVNASNKQKVGDYIVYTTQPITIYEGQLLDWNFKVDKSIIDQEFIIRDNNIDLDTLKVFVKEDEKSTKLTEYRRVNTLIGVNPNDNIYYVTINYSGYYRIFFGNNIIGKSPEDGSIIQCEYVVNSGHNGNGAKDFKFNNNLNTVDVVVEKVEVISDGVSWGGSDPHSIDENRYLMKTDTKEQNRLIATVDFANNISKAYGNIESINAWGGEDNLYKQYGKTMVSIKPIYSDKITDNAKQYIKDNITSKKGYVANDIIFVDPEFINIEIEIHASILNSKTNLDMSSINAYIESSVKEFGDSKLGKFDSVLSNVDLLSKIKNDVDYIKNIRSVITLTKNVDVIENSNMKYDVVFGNQLDLNKPIYSDIIYYGLDSANVTECRLVYNNGHLILIDEKTKLRIGNEVYGKINYMGDIQIINFNLPKYTRTNSNIAKSNIGNLRWFVTPLYNDIETYNNNILRITNIKPMAKLSNRS